MVMDDQHLSHIHLAEMAETDLRNVRRLVEAASQDENLDRFAEGIVLYASAEGWIADANPIACELLGYSLDELRELRISDLDITEIPSSQATQRYVESSIEIEHFDSLCRQHDGGLFAVRVQKQPITRDGIRLWHYVLEDRSLRASVWKEIIRREDSDFQFREKMKALNEINTTLGVTETLDTLCRKAVELGRNRLGFDRLSIWLYDPNAERMTGTYGVDEQGTLREEHGSSWPIIDTPIADFAKGQKTPIISADSAPIYDGKSQIIGYGWHISVPMHHEERLIGFMSADNFLGRKPIRTYEPDLLRIYAAAVGQYCAHHLVREGAKKLASENRIKQERLQLLGTFITHIGHDFRTPLTLINTSAYLLGKSTDAARKADLTAKIEDQVHYIKRVVNQMLETISAEESSEYDFAPTQLRAVLNGAVESVAGRAVEKGIHWTIEEIPPIALRADQEQLERAIREILLNAIQFTHPGGSLVVSACADESDLTIRVKDTGIGISADEMEKIFHHLYRVDPARTTQGVGLGLTLAKQIVEAHGGQIKVVSTPGEGSTFEIHLPIKSGTLSANNLRVDEK